MHDRVVTTESRYVSLSLRSIFNGGVFVPDVFVRDVSNVSHLSASLSSVLREGSWCFQPWHAMGRVVHGAHGVVWCLEIVDEIGKNPQENLSNIYTSSLPGKSCRILEANSVLELSIYIPFWNPTAFGIVGHSLAQCCKLNRLNQLEQDFKPERSMQDLDMDLEWPRSQKNKCHCWVSPWSARQLVPGSHHKDNLPEHKLSASFSHNKSWGYQFSLAASTLKPENGNRVVGAEMLVNKYDHFRVLDLLTGCQ